jgi:Transposase IS116/IS110/IS902 family
MDLGRAKTRVQVLAFDRRIMAWHRSNQISMRLDEIPGVDPALATALVAGVADPKVFRLGRNFSVWIGLVPKHAREPQGSAAPAGRASEENGSARPLTIRWAPNGAAHFLVKNAAAGCSEVAMHVLGLQFHPRHEHRRHHSLIAAMRA